MGSANTMGFCFTFPAQLKKEETVQFNCRSTLFNQIPSPPLRWGGGEEGKRGNMKARCSCHGDDVSSSSLIWGWLWYLIS